MNTIEIYGTLGPACAGYEILKEMFQEGMTGIRLNLSHTGLAESAGWIAAFHRAAADAGVTPQLLIDLQGPELRIDALAEPFSLSCGDSVRLTSIPVGGSAAFCSSSGCGSNPENAFVSRPGTRTQPGFVSERTPLPPEIPVPQTVIRAVRDGDHLLLDDGRIELEVTDASDPDVMCRVLRDGILFSHKSIKIVGRDVDAPVLTPQDLENLRAAADYGVTAVMLPFVRSGADLRALRQAMESCGAPRLRVFAKIENRLGMDHLDEILPEADMIVIARGDLGNDMPLWELPSAQAQIEAQCRAAQKPFLVVTQLLDSMVHNPVPTRAEVSDIYHAVIDGAAALMVTNETAVGAWPAGAIRYLTRTAQTGLQNRMP